MRGKVTVIPSRACTCRITPAYAGKRKPLTVPTTAKKDHPRLCGEKFYYRLSSTSWAGSPPPMRGKVFRHTHAQDGFRITPAYAGKRPFRGAILPECQDHPRLCGEKIAFTNNDVFRNGSPPPMRGKACIKFFLILTQRITPAYAGKRYACILRWGLGEDHPRLCGEKYM